MAARATALACMGRVRPGVVLLVAAALAPLAAAVWVSLGTAAGIGACERLWGSWRGWELLGRTIALGSLAATLACLLAAGVAACIARLSGRAALLAAALTCLPMLLPSSLLATAWIVALGRQGPLTPAVAALLHQPQWTIFTFGGVAAALALRYFGLAVVILTLHRLAQRRAWPARRAFALSPWAAGVQLDLRPMLGPLVVAWLLVLLAAANDHVMPDMLLISTYGTEILILFSAFYDSASAASLAMPMAIAAVAVLPLLRVELPREEASAQYPPRAPGPAGLAAAGLAIAAALTLSLGAPAAVLAWRAGSWSALAVALASAQDQAWTTLRLASSGAVLCTAAAAVLADDWVWALRQSRRSAAPLVLVGLAVPPSLIGIGMLHAGGVWPLALVQDTSAPLVLAYVARFLPIAMLVLFAVWRQEPPLPRLAARAFGLGRWATLRHVLVPARWVELAACLLMCMLLMGTELELSILLSSPGGATLGVRLATMIHTAPDAVVSALALDMLMLAAPLMAALIALLHLGARRRQNLCQKH